MNLHHLRMALRELRALPRVRKIIEETKDTQAPVTLSGWFAQKVFGINREAYWPTHFTSKVGCAHNILAGIASAPGLSPGCYIQGLGKIYIGDYTMIAANVGIISANHDVHDHRKHSDGEVRLGKYCWIGLNSSILPGTNLGDFTVVGAGSVVNKPFPEGYCVVAGSPAKVIRKLDPSECVAYRDQHEYYGYISVAEFPAFRSRFLRV
jgi:acetyltransferase-like isoleucine patch superfamily enzyme